ncbi:MAG: Gfo/Idh/MocA family oxidoreductase [Anaerolineae bacterium]|nr:Gfo/Idh/MocA family oxidoreductase [Anaerolineae bacterium]
MKVGIAGAGFMGSTHAAAWKDTAAQIVGFVADPPHEANNIAAQYGAKVFNDYASMLAEVDIVDICTPTFLHCDMVLQAAAAGKHIICEKPLALSIEEGQKMISACKKAGVQLHVAQVVRFFPEYALAKQTVASGEIGAVGVVRLSRGSFRPKKPNGNWFLDESKSGGIMMDLMVHDFDYARWISGDVESVFARKITRNFPDSPVDYATAILKHRSGAISHVAGAWAYPPPTFRTAIEISGDGGMIEFDSDTTAPIRNLIQKPGSSSPDVGLPSSPVSESPYTTEIKEFYAAITENKAVRVVPLDGLAAVQIALAAIESVKSGKAVQLTSLVEA